VRHIRIIFLALLSLCVCASATETIRGIVLNGTTGKPAVGDDIALLTLDNGSLEVSRGKTAGDGSFRLATEVLGKHLLRVRHDGVIYQEELTSGVPPRIQVFDASSELSSVHGLVSVMKVESSGGNLHVTELHSISNESNPPRTLANARNLELLLPPKAIVDSLVVQAPFWHPEKVKPVAVSNGSHQLAVGYPLRPGTTQFAIKYHLPYAENAALHPRLQYPTDLWTVLVPKSMSFRALNQASFHPLMDRDGMQVEAISKARPGEIPGFRLSGAGSLPAIATLASTPKLAAPVSAHSQAHADNLGGTPAKISLASGAIKPMIWLTAIGLLLLIGIVVGKRLASIREHSIDTNT
jgi:hypothetical protein